MVKKPKMLEDFNRFVNGEFRNSPGIPLSKSKSTVEKIWFLNKSAINIAIAYLDTFGLEALPYQLKVVVVLAIFLSPLIGVLIWILAPRSGPRMSKERRDEILAKAKEKVRLMREKEKAENKGEDPEDEELNSQSEPEIKAEIKAD